MAQDERTVKSELYRNTMMSATALCMLMASNAVFASLMPLSCRLFYHGDMERILRKTPDVLDQFSCTHAGQVPFIDIHVRPGVRLMELVL